MIILKQTFDSIKHYYKDSSVFENLVLNGATIDDIYDYLEESDIYSVYSEDNKFLGFFSVDTNEIHAYILESERKYSKNILLKMMDYSFNTLDLNYILTYVWGNYNYIMRFLKMLGFKHVYTEEGLINSEDGNFDLYHLILNKEDYNGKFIQK